MATAEDTFRRLAREMRATGNGDLLKDLQKALQQAVRPVTPRTRAVAMSRLPSRGGLNARVARAPQRVTARSGETLTSVRLTVAGKKSGAAGADVGQVRHPVFDRPGRRRTFVTQRVPPGWFTETVEAQRDQMVRDVEQVLDDFTNRLAQRLRR
jgi:hypothetical protein